MGVAAPRAFRIKRVGCRAYKLIVNRPEITIQVGVGEIEDAGEITGDGEGKIRVARCALSRPSAVVKSASTSSMAVIWPSAQ